MQTKRSGPRRSSRWTRVKDRTAGVVITAGGMSVLLAMLGICVFLVWEAAPLLRPGSADPAPAAAAALDAAASPAVVRIQADAPRALLADARGTFRTVDLTTGAVLDERSVLPEGFEATALAETPGGDRILFGSADGRVVGVTFRYRAFQLADAEGLPGLAELPAGAAVPLGDEGLRRAVAALAGAPADLSERDYVERADGTTFRVRRLEVEAGEPHALAAGSGPVTRLAIAESSRGRRLAAMRGDGSLHFGEVRVRRRLDGRGASEQVSWRTLDHGGAIDPAPDFLALLDGGASIVAASEGGRLLRLRPDGGRAEPVEAAALVEHAGDRLTVVRQARGSSSLIVGDSTGRLRALTVVNAGADAEPATLDGRRMAVTFDRAVGDAAVVSVGLSERDRTVAVGLADGGVQMFNLTSGKRVVSLPARKTGAAAGSSALVALAPPLTGVASFAADGGYRYWRMNPGYPEASFASLFGRVHYEGRDRPEFVYQATPAEGEEPKYSLVPLVFGTVKATVFAMLFAVPVSVLAAIYTSEFLHPKVRRVVKPSIELMASLPSVVLGFVAAMLLAPIVRDILPGLLIAFGVVPLAVLVAASLWRVVPLRHARRLPTLGQLGIIAAAGAVGVAASVAAGPPVERALFAPTPDDRRVAAGLVEPLTPEATPRWVAELGDIDRSDALRLRNAGLYAVDGRIVRPDRSQTPPPSQTEPSLRRWLDGDFGTAFPGWLLALVPPAGVVVALLRARLLTRRWTALVAGQPRWRVGLLELGRLAAQTVATLALAAAVAWVFQLRGLDPRESIFGPFTQRNTLVVGLIMGFAIIPIIFTLSEDALRSVPNALRAGSLGAGATPWQTAVRVVLPVAGSGIFSACMIGLGRAVGETMIVLMATGSTPTLDWNIFEGFRALSANIATEMPEVSRGGTHYRVLFLCGLTLFAMTLVINTTAEFVRQHFRRRNAAL